MVRIFSFAALALVAICLVIGASIALADDRVPADPQSNPVEAIDPDRRMLDDSLAAEDVYEFDFVVTSGEVANPEFDAPAEGVEI